MEQYKEPLSYIAKNRDLSVRMRSQSGGMFSVLSEEILNADGIIYGCVLDEKWNACHIRGRNRSDRDRMMGSKYVQSEMQNVFRQVHTDLKDGKKVLFSGTSCQVAGLRAFLKEDYENLYCVDILCHGVASPQVWQKYLNWQESRFGKCMDVNFRNKKFGWHSSFETLKMKSREKYREVKSSIYASVFYSDNALRPACYRCPYKETMHPGDLTIADAWGIEEANPEFVDHQGCSLVLINSDKGKRLFEECKDCLETISIDLAQYMQEALIGPTQKPVKRKQFWYDYRTKSFKFVAEKYGGYGLKAHMKAEIVRLLEKTGSLETVKKFRKG